MKLYYQTYFDQVQQQTDQDIPVIIIPGLFGTSGNWRGFAAKLAEHRRVVVVDQRNHGRSPHADENSYFDLVADILELIDDLGFEKVDLCGHSMGGKTAMVFALTYPQRLRKLVVLDIAPVQYGHSHHPILQALADADLINAKSRSDVEQQLMQAIPDKNTRLFIMLSLAGKAGDYSWRLNVPALTEYLPSIIGFPNDELEHKTYDEECLFVRGALSNYVDEKYIPQVLAYFPKAKVQSVENAGHWLHVEQQDAVLEQVQNFLKKE